MLRRGPFYFIIPTISSLSYFGNTISYICLFDNKPSIWYSTALLGNGKGKDLTLPGKGCMNKDVSIF